jgi:hypothetical protein
MPAKKIPLRVQHVFVLTYIDYHSQYLALFTLYIYNSDFVYGKKLVVFKIKETKVLIKYPVLLRKLSAKTMGASSLGVSLF